MASIDNLRLIGISGTNKVMTGELSRIARRAVPGKRFKDPKKQGLGAIVYPFDTELAAAAVQYHRTSSRVLWDLCESSARRLEPLYDEFFADLSADRRDWLWDGASISIRPRNVGSFAAGERQVVGAVKNAVVDAAKKRGFRVEVAPENPDIHLALRMHEGVVSLSVDLAGRSMHQRGYRVESGDAPLRENLAAVLVMLARHDSRKEALVDPLAGSGTIAIEAALLGLGAPIWSAENPPSAFRLPAFRGLAPATENLFADSAVRTLASDIDARAVEMIRANAEAAGVGDRVLVRQTDLRDLSPRVIEKELRGTGYEDKPLLFVCNPPYGERLEGGELDLYDDMLGWAEQFSGARLAVLIGNPQFEEVFSHRARIRKPIKNGSIRCYFSVYDL